MAALTSIRSKNDRAIVAYLLSLPAVTGITSSIFPFKSSNTLAYPNVVVRSTTGQPDPLFMGNDRFRVLISIRGSNVKNANPDAGWIAHDALIGAVRSALSQSSDNSVSLSATAALINAAGRALATSSPAANADMADYTCQEWLDRGLGDGKADAEGCAWEEVLIFESLCCESNTD